MPYRDIIFGRLEVFINHLKATPIRISGKMKLGLLPIGYDTNTLDYEFRPPLNRNAIGFADVLVRDIAKSEVSETTTVAELVDAIVTKSRDSVNTAPLYEAKVSERVRLGLREHIAKLAGIEEREVLPTKKVTDYVKSEQFDELLSALNGDLKKYLIGGPIRRRDLDGTVNAATEDIVLRMLA